MSQFLTGWLIVWAVAMSTPAQAGGPNQSTVPKGFHYPESPETIQVEVPFQSNSLAGRVVDSAGSGVEKVLVECLRPGWVRRRSARFTDSEGAFVFPKQSTGMRYLRLSKPGFKTMLVKVVIAKKAQPPLQLELRVSQ
jgi:hypothetical protein